MVQQTKFDKEMEKLEQEVKEMFKESWTPEYMINPTKYNPPKQKDDIDKILVILEKQTSTFDELLKIVSVQNTSLKIFSEEIAQLQKIVSDHGRSINVLGNALKNHMMEQGK